MIAQRNANLLTFFDNLGTSVMVTASEKDIKVIQGMMRVQRKRFQDDSLTKYNEFFTPFAFQKLHDQYEQLHTVAFTSLDSNKGTTAFGIVVTKGKCSCSFFIAMELPCKHIFEFYKELNMNLSDPFLCAKRWSKSYYHQSHPALRTIPVVDPSTSLYVQRIRVPDEINKFKTVVKVTREITSIASYLSTGRFTDVMDKLKNIRQEILAGPGRSHALLLVRFFFRRLILTFFRS